MFLVTPHEIFPKWSSCSRWDLAGYKTFTVLFRRTSQVYANYLCFIL